MNNEETIVRMLKALQEQINYLDKKVCELKGKIYSLEEESRWNVAHGNLERVPWADELVQRLANGKLAFGTNVIDPLTEDL